MDRIATIIADAQARGLRPWYVLKERLAELAIRVVARAGGPAVLQGGAALHFAYGSSRLSADVDFAGVGVASALVQHGEEVARAAAADLDCAAAWSLSSAGRLTRGKVTIVVDAARQLVLPVEAYEVPAHCPRADPVFGAVETPAEIAADKIVASADRLARRGTLKLTDLYDLFFILTRLGEPPPDRALIERKLLDYGQAARGADLAAAVRAVPKEELRSALQGVLPIEEFRDLDEAAVIETAAVLMEPYRDAL